MIFGTGVPGRRGEINSVNLDGTNFFWCPEMLSIKDVSNFFLLWYVFIRD